MYLQPKQSQRFTKLYNALTLRVAKRLGIASPNSLRFGSLTKDEESETLECIYGPDGTTEYIDDFISDNPARLNRTDLRQIEEWKSGVFAEFVVVPKERDMFYVRGNYAFAVRAPQNGAIQLSNEPELLFALILPFDGVITSSGPLFSEPTPLGTSLNHVALEQLDEIQAIGHMVRSARDLMRVVEEDRFLAEEQEYEQDHLTDGAMGGMHRGALAGLSPQEREAAVREHSTVIKDMMSQKGVSFYKDMMKEDALNKEPKSNLFDYYMSMKKLDLKTSVDEAGLGWGLSSANKTQLANTLVDFVMQNTNSAARVLAIFGPTNVRDARRIVEAGGRLDIEYDEIDRFGQVPEPATPIVQLYFHRNTFTALIPDELYPTLAAQDWDECVRMAESLRESLRITERLTELYGIVKLNDALMECHKRQGGEFDAGLFMLALNHPITAECHGIYVDYPDESNPGDAYIIGESLIEVLELSELNQDDYFASLMHLLNTQSMLPPAPLKDELLAAQDFEDWCSRQEAGTRLIAFLDEHVPDDADDYSFADDLMFDLVSLSRHNPNLRFIDYVLEDRGLLLSNSEFFEFEELLIEFADHVPRWTNNGWTEAEARGLRAKRGPRFKLVD